MRLGCIRYSNPAQVTQRVLWTRGRQEILWVTPQRHLGEKTKRVKVCTSHPQRSLGECCGRREGTFLGPQLSHTFQQHADFGERSGTGFPLPCTEVQGSQVTCAEQRLLHFLLWFFIVVFWFLFAGREFKYQHSPL